MAKTKKAAKKAKIAKKKPAAPKKAPAPKKKPAAPKKKAPAPKKKLAAPKKKAPAPKKAAAAPKKAAPAPKKKAAAPKKDKPAPISRRDGGGHVNEKYAAELLEKSHRSQDKDERDGAFLRGKSKNDPLADELGKEFLETATSGEDEGNEIRDELETEELGGPFVATTAAQEYDYEPDESNPKGSRREPFPNT